MLAIDARENRNAFGAALGMHLLLAAGLLVSLNWSRQTPPPVQAELWSGLPPQLPATQSIVQKPITGPTPPTPAPPEPKADISTQKKQEPPKKPEPSKVDKQKEMDRQEALKKAAEQKRAEQRAAAQLEAQR